MDWIGLLQVSFIVIIALVTAHFLAKKFGAPPFEGRFYGIDGLRGFLSLFVFINHSAIWHNFAKNGDWRNDMSGLFKHLGQDSVWIFFMITGFLFFSKLLEARKQKFDWIRLYVSRILRLYPLYLLAMGLFFLTTAILLNFQSGEPWLLIVIEALQWLGFSIPGNPRLCGITPVPALVGVVWTLVYEWIFYFSLPLQALFLRIIPPFFFIAASVASAFLWPQLSRPLHFNLLAFGAGILSSFLVKSALLKRLAGSRLATLGIIGCVAITLAVEPGENQSTLLLIPLFVIFLLIASGNDVFGILVSPAARTLGGMSYSIYLLHSFLLFAFFHFLLGQKIASHLSIPMHWASIDFITPFLVVLGFATWQWIEKPPMRYTAALTAWVRATLTLRGRY